MKKRNRWKHKTRNAFILAKLTFSLSLSSSVTQTHTHTFLCHPDEIQLYEAFLSLSFSKVGCVSFTAIRYTPTDGALPFTARTFCEFSHHRPSPFPVKNNFFFSLWLRMWVFACLQLSQRWWGANTDEEEAGVWLKGLKQPCFWEVMSNESAYNGLL